MKEMNAPNRYAELFIDQYNNPESDHWDTIYQDFDAAVDWPTAAFVEPLVEKYPDAKIILTERDPDAWIKSMNNTILRFRNHNEEKLRKLDQAEWTPEQNARRDMADKIILGGLRSRATEHITDENVKAMFLEHNARIKAIVPKERLLVMDTTEMNWKALCDFLGITDIPKEPFPRVNSTADAKARFARERGDRNKGIFVQH
ncbi:hypothetical protein BCR43DRAFT_493345 [Syncephalastrum racemosum]|uniref:P-loop containing nucleoside triphosphate hydrolase protein n=1 Tax=Syncephalastrum racemosum TaxID=13706 RepID=A0A1X2HAH1_SYNRA|nr:hypothetical protein BCR43DRAFT_493345 [Syncephalastrum racemosum]